jgi:hypothetical protein
MRSMLIGKIEGEDDTRCTVSLAHTIEFYSILNMVDWTSKGVLKQLSIDGS